MISIEIYDPAMCCSTGVCGPSVDPELIRVSTVVHNLKSKNIDVARYNLASEPDAFVTNRVINQLLTEQGPEVLPVVLLNGQVTKIQGYPSMEEWCAWTGLAETDLAKKPKMRIELKTKQ
ncbi:arsenite efflux transporter metallochaperone ArsD [Paenibacillus lautus]|uniref:arsenite efflux transporter metallochaperone ArsD n=1 Tax=Paenibacillus TaxID=44249 RepID=UPI002FBD7AE8